jgi:antitoxin VapB
MTITPAEPDSRRLAEDLAALTGETVDQAVREALRERLDRERRRRGRADVADSLMAIGRRCAARPVRDPRPLDDLLGYDEDGLPR